MSKVILLLGSGRVLQANCQAENLERMRAKCINECTKVMDSYSNLTAPLDGTINAYNNFHKRLELGLQGNIDWIDETGKPLAIDQQASVNALFSILGQEVAKALGDYKLQEEDENSLIKAIKRHRAKVEEIVSNIADTSGHKQHSVVITMEPTPTAELAGEKLLKRMFH